MCKDLIERLLTCGYLTLAQYVQGIRLDPLYHFTYARNASLILTSGAIGGFLPKNQYVVDERGRIIKDRKLISVSRNPNFNFGSIRFTLDTERVSAKYKIIPYQEKPSYRQDPKAMGVSEEVIVADRLDMSYISQIEVVESRREPGAREDLKNIVRDRGYGVYSALLKGETVSYNDRQVLTDKVMLGDGPFFAGKFAVIGLQLVKLTLMHKITPGPWLAKYAQKFEGMQDLIKVPLKD